MIAGSYSHSIWDKVRQWRKLPPAGASVAPVDLIHGIGGLWGGQAYKGKVEAEMKAALGVQEIFFVSSGKAALTLILNALKSRSPRREVVIPAYTCYSVPSAVIKADLDLVLCDVDPSTFDFKADQLEQLVTEKTLCVVCDHLFGIPSDMSRIQAICRNKGAFLVEDVAQAMGGTYQGDPLGAIGEAGFFSFGRGKHVTCGAGGAVATNSRVMADAIRPLYEGLEYPGFVESMKDLLEAALTAIFIHPALYRLPGLLPFLKLGQTFFYREFPVKKLSEMKLGLLARWQERLSRANETRRQTAGYFLMRSSVPKGLSPSIAYLRLPILMENREARDRLLAVAESRGWGFSTMYPAPINEIPEIRSMFSGKTYPSAKDISEKLVTIPTHEWLTGRDRREIGDHLALLGGARASEKGRQPAPVDVGASRAEAR